MPLPKSVKKERIIENAEIGHFEIEDGDMREMDRLDEYLVTGGSPHCPAICVMRRTISGDMPGSNTLFTLLLLTETPSPDWDPTDCP
jgi:hypothetical protein